MAELTELGTLGSARLWLVDLDAGSEADDWPFLDPDEQARAARFVFAKDRRRYVAAHSALRRLLARHTGRALADVRYGLGEFGKPHLTDPPGCVFNLSHSDNVGLIALADRGELGVDVEVLRPVPDAAALARDNFTPAEQATLSRAPAADRDLVFFWGWTRKEACLKATGSGLSIAPKTFEVGLTGEARDLAVPTAGGAARIRVHSFRHGPRVLGALAQAL